MTIAFQLNIESMESFKIRLFKLNKDIFTTENPAAPINAVEAGLNP